MKVIEHGNTLKIHICNKCGCKYEFTSKDYLLDYDDEGGYHEYVQCPECNNTYFFNI